jgi:ribonucleoside-triphosphate reductase
MAKQHVTSELQGRFDINSTETTDMLIATFQNMLIEKTNLVGEQLLERYNFQKTAYAMQFPFMSTNNLWNGLGSLASTDEVGDALNSGTLGIGFVGGLSNII